jgi:hypothetical protein
MMICYAPAKSKLVLLDLLRVFRFLKDITAKNLISCSVLRLGLLSFQASLSYQELNDQTHWHQLQGFESFLVFEGK